MPVSVIVPSPSFVRPTAPPPELAIVPAKVPDALSSPTSSVPAVAAVLSTVPLPSRALIRSSRPFRSSVPPALTVTLPLVDPFGITSSAPSRSVPALTTRPPCPLPLPQPLAGLESVQVPAPSLITVIWAPPEAMLGPIVPSPSPPSVKVSPLAKPMFVPPPLVPTASEEPAATVHTAGPELSGLATGFQVTAPEATSRVPPAALVKLRSAPSV